MAGGGAVLAGGTDAVIMRRHGSLRSETMVDIKRVPGIAGLVRHDTGWWLGATTTMRDLTREATVPPIQAVGDGAALVGAPQTRRRATVGGNVWRASPSADTVPGLLVCDAQVRLLGADGVRIVPLSQFFTGPGRHVGREGELLEAFDLPDRGGASAYQRVTHRAALDLATVGVAVWVRMADGICVDARVAVGGAAPTSRLIPLAAERLVGSTLDRAALTSAAEAAGSTVSPIDDVRGSAAFKRHSVGVLVTRVASAAAARCTGGAR